MLVLLKAGKDLTLDDSRMVRSCDVVGETAAPSSFLVLDVPDLDLEYCILIRYCFRKKDSLESCETIRNVDNFKTVFHFSPYDVVTSPRYTKWLEGVGENVMKVLVETVI
jgi:hypothetical protein